VQAAKLHSALARILAAMQPPNDGTLKANGATHAPAYAVPGGCVVALTALSLISATFLLAPSATNANGTPVANHNGAEASPVTLTLQWNKSSAATELPAPTDQPASLFEQLSRCSVVSQPELPAWAIAWLEALLEARREAAFLAAASALALPAAALQTHLLDPAAQQAAGLLPGALTVESQGLLEEESGGSEAPCVVAECTVLVRQLSRAARVRIRVGSDGVSLLRLLPLPVPGINSDTTWMAAVWEQQMIVQLPEIAGTGAGVALTDGCYECRVTAASLGHVLQLFLQAVARAREAAA